MKRIFYLGLITLFISLFLTSCLSDTNEAKGPGQEEFKKPITQSFEFTEEEVIDWVITDPDSIQAPTSFSLDIDKLPSRPFEIGEFKPLKTPLKEYTLDWGDQAVIPLQYDTVDYEPALSILPEPITSKIDLPRIAEGTTSGLLQLSQSEGLPSEEIKSIIQNEDGTYWIATWNGGVCFYNGENLYTYDYKSVFDLALDRKGKLWIGTSNGLYILDFQKNIQWYYNSPLIHDLHCDSQGLVWIFAWDNAIYVLDEDLNHLRVLTNEGFDQSVRIIEDSDFNLWVGLRGHIRIIDKDRKSFRRLDASAEYQIGFVFNLLEDKKGNIWIANGWRNRNDVAALIISLQDETLKVLTHDDELSRVDARLIQEDNYGRIWMIRDDVAYILSEDHTKIKKIVTNGTITSNFRVGYITKDDRGVIWIGTNNRGAILIDPSGPLVEHLDEQNGLLNPFIWSMEVDSRENIWMGSPSGIDIYDPVRREITAIDNALLKKEGGNIRSIEEYEKDKYFIDADKGFYLFDRTKNRMMRHLEEEVIARRIHGVLKDDEGNFWMGTGTGLGVYNPKSNQLKVIPERSAQWNVSGVRDIIEDEQGNYWIGTENEGIVKVDPQKNTIQYVRKQEGLCDDRVMNMIIGPGGNLWVATFKGISIINMLDQKITNIGEKEGLIPDEMYVLRNIDNVIYGGSVNGLIRIEKPSKENTEWRFNNYASDQAFPSNDYIIDVGANVNNEQLWFATTGKSNKLTIVTQPPHIDSSSCPVHISSINIMDEEPSFTKLADMLPIFDTHDTLWYDNRTQFYLEHTFPKDSGYVFENNINWDSVELPYKTPIGLTLPYDQNSLRFSFSNVCVLNRDYVRYKYILAGEDKNWTFIGDKPESKNYYNLTPGSYTFKVSTKDFSGNWSENDELSFRILPPWWRTWWAYLGYAIIAIAGIGVIVQLRSRRLKKKNRLLEEKVAVRTTKLRETIDNLKSTQAQLVQSEKMASLGELTAGIAHEIQNPLNFVNNFSEVSTELIEEMNEEIENGDFEEVKAISADLKQNLEKIHHHGKRADSIVKGMLQHSRTSTGLVEPTDINVLTDEYLRLAYHGLRAKDKTFNATMDTDFDEALGKVEVVAQDLGRVILNLITNAFYTVDKKAKRLKTEDPESSYKPTVTVSTNRIDNLVKISVTDNGNGIPQEAMDKIFQPFFTTKPTGEGTGLGLSMSYEIIKNGHSGELKVDSIEGEGTTFTIELKA